jgi:hypothetical protein
MNETVMKLSSDGRIVQIDNVSWSYYIDVDRARSLEDHKSGKWMHFFNDISFAAAICRKAVLEGTVAACKHSSASVTNDGCGVICFYLNADDLEAHRRTLTFMLKNDLIRRTKAGKLYNIGFKLDDQTRAGEYGSMFNAKIKLEDFVDLETGEFL